MNITLKAIPDAEDKDKTILLDGERVGVAYRGWLRLGGDQWVAHLTGGATCGEKTLRDLKSAIAHRLKA
jgi:hypothetical protein